MSEHSASATLYSVHLGKLDDRPFGSVRGCDLQTLGTAPFGNLVRVCFDLDDLRPSRERAKKFAEFLLPVRVGVRHFVVRESFRSFIVGLAPDQYRANEIIRSVHHSVRSLAVVVESLGNCTLPRLAKGRPAGWAA